MNLFEATEGHPEFRVSEWAIIHAYRGSKAHGTYIPPTDPNHIDDIDTVAVYIPPKQYYLGMSSFGSRGTKELKVGEWDMVAYELRKCLHLLKQGNPNILSLLWTEPENIISVDLPGEYLLRNRHLFIGKHVYKSFMGYVRDQRHKMTHAACQGYMGEKRKALVKQYGYDCKNAAHAIRLAQMCIEFLREGRLYIDRTGRDADKIISIKSGLWKLVNVQRELDYLLQLAECEYGRSILPEEPDSIGIENLCIEMLEQFLWKEQE